MTTRITPTPAVLYSFHHSVFASIVELVVLEKGFGPEILQIRTVDLSKGENFSPSFLKISPAATIPALVTPFELTKTGSTQFKSLTNTIAICEFLDSSTLGAGHSSRALAPATMIGSESSKFILTKIGESDPNFLFMSWRSDEERRAKLHGFQGQFILGRQVALERYSTEALAQEEDPRLNKFYENKLAENGGLLALYEGRSDSANFIKASESGWKKVDEVLIFLEAQLKKTTFLVGDQLSLADIHAGGYLMRVLSCKGGKSLKEAASTLATLGQFPKLHVWLESLIERDSFKKIYAAGLH